MDFDKIANGYVKRVKEIVGKKCQVRIDEKMYEGVVLGTSSHYNSSLYILVNKDGEASHEDIHDTNVYEYGHFGKKHIYSLS